jgi:hypothetical protein
VVLRRDDEGLVDQIENSARGHIPDDQQLLLQRMEDEQVRRAFDRGCDRRAVKTSSEFHAVRHSIGKEESDGGVTLTFTVGDCSV